MPLVRRMGILIAIAAAIVLATAYLVPTDEARQQAACARSPTWNCSWGPAFLTAGFQAAVPAAIAVAILASVVAWRASHGLTLPSARTVIVAILLAWALGFAAGQVVDEQYRRAYPQCESGDVHDWNCIDEHVTLDVALRPVATGAYSVAIAIAVVALARWHDGAQARIQVR